MIFKFKVKGIFSALVAIMTMAALAVTTTAQTGSSSVYGTVTDQQGAVVAGATVRLINEQKGFNRTVVANNSGSFTFSSVPPETYQLEVEASGFKKRVVSNVTVLIDIPRTINAVLEIGSVTEVVNVSSSELESIINNQDASLGNNFVSKQIQELPLEGRNVADLLSLQPGVTQGGEVSGARSDQANITLDGVDVNDQQNGTAFTPVLRVTPDSVDEFRVTTSNADSARGRSSGAQISLSTKSGSNQFNGALYEYHRNTITSANDFFSNLNGVERPKLIRNLFGGRIGGPIKKDRLFFFYNYEALREARETPVTNLVPLASLGQGSIRFPDENGNIVTMTAAQINALTTNGQPGGTPVVNVNPAGLAVLAAAASRYPANDFTIGDGLNTAGFRFNAAIPSANNTHTARVDWKVTSDDKHAVSFRLIAQDDFFDATQQFLDTDGSRRKSRPFGLVGSHTWLINNNMVNNFRYGFTRQKFSDGGDSTGDVISFRGVFSPQNYSYPFTRRTDTQNFVDDISWSKGNHKIQFGGNIRIVRNFRSDESAIHDSAVVNRSFFAGSGNVLTNPILNTINPGTGTEYTIAGSNVLSTRDAMAAVLGRFSQYSFNSNFDIDGNPLALGVPVTRQFATEEYDVYGQDSWQLRQNLNLTFGVRYSLSRPVYETQGYQAAPNVGLEEYLNRRISASAQGRNYGAIQSEALIVNLAGPKNGKGNVYPWDKNNFQPNVSAAWSPNFKSGFLKKLFGANSASVLRGGFRITNDYFGQALAVNFEGNNRLGFASSLGISANTYNVSTNPGPLFSGFNQLVRTLPLPPGGSLPTNLTFPQQQPLDGQRRIEGSLDSNLVSPINYQWNVTYGRELPAKLYVEVSYVGRLAKNLLASRDIMGPNNIKDPVSGQTWYEAAGILDTYRRNGTPINSIPNLPFFENMFPAGSIDSVFFGAGLSNTRAAYGVMATNSRTAGCSGPPLFGCYEFGNDWTFLQDLLDQFAGPELFYQKQYGALSAYGTIASSNYHGATASVRQRFKGVSWDFNYTFSKSIDDASGVQTSGVFGSAFILNALRQQDNRSYSDFDTRHIINVNSIFELPIGKGKAFFSNMNKYANAVLGGWQISSIFRYNSGLPVTDGMVDVAGWPTNWNIRSYVTRIRDAQTSPTSTGTSGVPNLFGNPTAFYQSFRNAAPGETGDRNVIRYPGYITLDMGLAKSFQMPWNESHKVQFRVDTFNLTNTQRFTSADTIFGLDPFQDTPQSTFGNFSAIQGSPRVVQFAIRYDF
jgi:Carboxypeptidase regulatory-like domain